MHILLVALSLLLGLVSVFLILVVRIGATIANARRARSGDTRHVSATPVIGSVIGFIAVLIAPVGSFLERLRWSWLPLAIEVAVLGLCIAAWLMTERYRR
jgi:hypothetical protein